jgi:hypothetical protein
VMMGEPVADPLEGREPPSEALCHQLVGNVSARMRGFAVARGACG